MQLLEQKKHQNKPSECIFINVMVVVRTQMHYNVHCCLLQYHWLIVVCYTHKHKNPHIVNAIVRSHYLSAYSLTYSGYWCIYYTYKTFIHLRINPVFRTLIGSTNATNALRCPLLSSTVKFQPLGGCGMLHPQNATQRIHT